MHVVVINRPTCLRTISNVSTRVLQYTQWIASAKNALLPSIFVSSSDASECDSLQVLIPSSTYTDRSISSLSLTYRYVPPYTLHTPTRTAVTHETPFYSSLNESLRSTNRSDLKPFYSWLVLTRISWLILTRIVRVCVCK